MNVSTNMGVADRAIRLLFAMVLIGNGVYFGWPLALVAGAVLAVTGMVGVCPLYLPFHASTVGMPNSKLL